MKTDASLGFLRMAYQGIQVAANVREAEKFALVRLVGDAPRAFSDPRADLTQTAKVGF